MRQRSLRTTFSVIIGLIVVIALAGLSYMSLQMSRAAYLNLALNDLGYIADLMVRDLDPIAAASNNAQDFARKAEPVVRHVGDQYFAKNGMSGYANLFATDGSVVFHPKLAANVNLMRDLGPQGVDVMTRSRAIAYNGTIFYDWQNEGETRAREKFAVIRTLPSHPDWVLYVTAYTSDDLLLAFRPVQYWLVGGSAVAILLTLLYVFWNTSRMVRVIQVVQRQLARMSEGDLGESEAELTVVSRRRDELGDMARTLQTTVTNLRTLVEDVRGTSERVSAVAQSVGQAADESALSIEQVARAISGVAADAGQLSQSSADADAATSELKLALEQVARGAQEQSQHVQATVETFRRLTVDMESLVAMVTQVQGATEANGASAREGLSLSHTTTQGMEQIRSSVTHASERLSRLSESSRQIGSISEAITEIADQTNLLALNAAIEAARAGEHGRGFAVVADEVRKLAERAARSAGEINNLVDGIQSGITSLAAAMEQSKQQVTDGADLVRRSGQAFEQVVQGVHQSVDALQSVTRMATGSAAAADRTMRSIDSVAAIIEENTAAAEEMMASAEQVQTNIRAATHVATGNAAATEEVSASVEEVTGAVDEMAGSARRLRTLATELKGAIQRFQV